MIDLAAIRTAAAAQADRPTPGVADIAAYCAAHNRDPSHREILGSLLPGGGASGVVVHRGRTVAAWGDPDRPEMTFSVTKSVLSLTAGLAVDEGVLALDDTVPLAELDGTGISWRHLLTQTSGWDGELWGKPARVDAQSRGVTGRPGEVWAYNDVRVNLLALALTVALRRPLPEVFAARLARPCGLSRDWSWHGYVGATTTVDGRELAVVSGGAHWGGGLWMSARDLARVGELVRARGAGLLSARWIDASWTPTPSRPDYGLCWWLNDARTVFPDAPGSGRCARGNLGRHLLWIDRARDLVIASHWGDGVGQLLGEVSGAVPAAVSETDDHAIE